MGPVAENEAEHASKTAVLAESPDIPIGGSVIEGRRCMIRRHGSRLPPA
jgi:hypothetical protein